MDFLKTLLVYLSLTFATSVQGAPTPAPTEIPTATPAAMTEAAPTEGVVTPPAVLVTETPAPTLTPAPAPSMTPNTSYRLLKQGSRGSQVKKLQERLKELGYLTGEVDGAYGAQTRRAVQRFQYYNGLQQDGEAGDSTQTILFECDTVVSAVTPTPPPTATPTAVPSATPTAELTIAPPEVGKPSPAPTEVPPLEAGTPAVDSSAADLRIAEDSSMVVNGSGAPLHALVMEDGVTVDRTLRLYLDENDAPLFAPAFLAQCLDKWSWAPDEGREHAYTLLADGYILYLTLEPNAQGEITKATLTVDGKPAELDAADIRLSTEGDVLFRPAVLEKAIGAQFTWETEEETLMMTYVSKMLSEAEG